MELMRERRKVISLNNCRILAAWRRPCEIMSCGVGVQVYMIAYHESVDVARFQMAASREKQAFMSIIRKKQHMVLPVDAVRPPPPPRMPRHASRTITPPAHPRHQCFAHICRAPRTSGGCVSVLACAMSVAANVRECQCP